MRPVTEIEKETRRESMRKREKIASEEERENVCRAQGAFV